MLRHPSQMHFSSAAAVGAANAITGGLLDHTIHPANGHSPSPIATGYATQSAPQPPAARRVDGAVAASAESAPSSTLPDAPLPPRNRARSSRTKWENLPEIGGGPRFTSEQVAQVQDFATKRQVAIEVEAKMDKGFHFGTECSHYCCFKRNLSEISARYFARLKPAGIDSSTPDTPALSAFQILVPHSTSPTNTNGDASSESSETSSSGWIQCSDMRLSVRCVASNGESITLVQRSPKRDKGPTYPVLPKPCQPSLDTHESCNMAVWERIQFSRATPAHYGPSSARKRAKPLATYAVIVELIARPAARSTSSTGLGTVSGGADQSVVMDGLSDIVIAKATSDPFIVRSRSPGQYGGAVVAAAGGSYQRMPESRSSSPVAAAGSAQRSHHLASNVAAAVTGARPNSATDRSTQLDYNQLHLDQLNPEQHRLPSSAHRRWSDIGYNRMNPSTRASLPSHPPGEHPSDELFMASRHIGSHRSSLGVNIDADYAASGNQQYPEHDPSAGFDGLEQRRAARLGPSSAHFASDHQHTRVPPHPPQDGYHYPDRPHSYPGYPPRLPTGPAPAHYYDPYFSSPYPPPPPPQEARLDPVHSPPYAYGYLCDGPYHTPVDSVDGDLREPPPLNPSCHGPYSPYGYPPLPASAPAAWARPLPPPPPHSSYYHGYYSQPTGRGGYDGYYAPSNYHFSGPPARSGGHFGASSSHPAAFPDSEDVQRGADLARGPNAALRNYPPAPSGQRDARGE